MKYAKANKIKMATRIRGGKKNKDEVYEEFFKEEVDLVIRGAKKPNILPSLIKREKV